VGELMKLINASCTSGKREEHVVTFHNNMEVIEENLEFPSNSLLVSGSLMIYDHSLISLSPEIGPLSSFPVEITSSDLSSI
jgi:hypothetical protein